MTLSSQILLKEGLIHQKSFSAIVEQSSYKQFHYITPLAKWAIRGNGRRDETTPYVSSIEEPTGLVIHDKPNTLCPLVQYVHSYD
jgi:hypothetical protein